MRRRPILVACRDAGVHHNRGGWLLSDCPRHSSAAPGGHDGGRGRRGDGEAGFEQSVRERGQGTVGRGMRCRFYVGRPGLAQLRQPVCYFTTTECRGCRVGNEAKSRSKPALAEQHPQIHGLVSYVPCLTRPFNNAFDSQVVADRDTLHTLRAIWVLKASARRRRGPSSANLAKGARRPARTQRPRPPSTGSTSGPPSRDHHVSTGPIRPQLPTFCPPCPL